MEKKYPVLKCDEELWNEIKPVLESFGINEFANETFDNNCQNYILSNYHSIYDQHILIGISYYYNIGNVKLGLRYLVNTKEEFLSAVAKLLGKEYPIKEDKQVTETKYPCVKCTRQLYDKIKDILINVGYKDFGVTDFENENILAINVAGVFGQISNVGTTDNFEFYNRYLCSNIQEFLTKACELKGFEVSYINNTNDDNSENHYFGYCVNNETKTIGIYENEEEQGLSAIVVENTVPKKKFRKKNKIENYVVSYDPAVGKDSTVVVTIPAKGNDFDKDKESMEKINIADKLRHCKQGTKLYSPIFGEVKFDYFDNNHIWVKGKTCENTKVDIVFTHDGKYYDCYSNAECLLFPSKDNRDWNSFQVLEEGHHVMVSNNGSDWNLRLYISDNGAIIFNSNNENEFALTWKYIVPVEDFDFTAEDITINKEKSII